MSYIINSIISKYYETYGNPYHLNQNSTSSYAFSCDMYQCCISSKLNLTSPHPFNPDALLQALQTDPDLRFCYALPAGIGEGLSVEEHTRRVLNQFTYHGQSVLPKDIPVREFQLFLALHDIGKGVAYAECGKNKDKELEYNKKILEKVLQQLSIPEHRIKIYLQLVSTNIVGDYLINLQTEQCPLHEQLITSANSIITASKAAGIAPNHFLALAQLFHKLDASSYLFLANRLFEKPSLYKPLKYKEAYRFDVNREIFFIQEMTKLHLTVIPPDSSEKIVLNTAAFLSKILKVAVDPSRETIDAILSNEANSRLIVDYSQKLIKTLFSCDTISLSKQKQFKQISESIKNIFFYCFDCKYSGFNKEESALFNFHSLLEKAQQKQKRASSLESNGTRLVFINKGEATELHPILIAARPAFDAVCISNKPGFYLNSLSALGWLQRQIHLKLDQDLIEQQIVDNTEDDILDVDAMDAAHITWATGTTSAIFANLAKSHYHLVPSGSFAKYDIIPFSGELHKGSQKNGVNTSHLSGIALWHIDIAIRYSQTNTMYGFNPINIHREFTEISETAQKIIDKRDSVPLQFLTPDISHLAFSILRTRAYPSQKSFCGRIFRSSLDFKPLALQLEKLKQHILNQPHNPHSTPSLAAHINEFEDAICNVNNAISKAVVPLTANQMQWINNAFPLIFASRSICPSFTLSLENLANGELQLGEDIQFVFVPKERIRQTTAFFAQSNIDIRVLPMETLQTAQRYEKIAAGTIYNLFNNNRQFT